MPPLFEKRSIRVEATREGVLYYYLIYRPDDGGGVYGRRSICPSSGVAYHDVVFADVNEGHDLAANLLSCAISFYLRAGIREVRMNAGFNVGGLLWPKFGFRPETEAEWRSTHGRIKKNLNRLPEYIKDLVEEDVRSIIGKKNPRAIWHFEQLNKHPVPVGKQVFGAGDRLLHRTTWKGILDLEESAALKILSARLRAGRVSKLRRKISVGVDG